MHANIKRVDGSTRFYPCVFVSHSRRVGNAADHNRSLAAGTDQSSHIDVYCTSVL
jgi:hypothetical protein